MYLRVCDDCGEEKGVQLCNPNSTHERCLKCHNKKNRREKRWRKDVYDI